MLKQRVITAIVLAPVTLAVLLLAPLSWFSLAIGIVAVLGAWEWSNFCLQSKPARVAYLAAVTFGLWLLSLLGSVAQVWVLAITLAFWVFGFFAVLRYPRLGLIEQSWVKAVMGVFVLLSAWFSMVGLRADDSGQALIALLLMLVWGADIGAYFTGKRFGSRKLMPAVSPGKTIEGLLGGLVVCVVISLVASVLFDLTPSATLLLALLAVVTGVFSVLGDLLESLFKRERGVKDSGRLLPGHGGILDRIDSITAAAPVFFAGVTYAQIF